jgi:hypothetical protein
MRKPVRPGSITVAAVFLFIYCFFGFCCNGIDFAGMFPGGGMTVTQGSGSQKFDMTEELSKHAPSYMVVMGLISVLGLLLSGVAVAAAVGLLQVKNWGRHLAIVWAAGYILVSLLSHIYDFAVLIPAKVKVQETMAQVGGSITVGRPWFVGWSVFTAVFMLFPVLLFFMVNGETVRRAFSGVPVPDEELDEDERRRPRRRDDYDDRDEDDYRRRPRREDEDDYRRRPRRREDEEEDDRPRARRRREDEPEEDEDRRRRRRDDDRDRD